MQQIDPNLINKIKDLLVDKFKPEKIIIFGSHAWGTPDQNSDLDIMIIVSRSDLRPAKRDATAHRTLRGIRIPMDIIVKTREEFDRFSHIAASLEYQVLNKGKIIYG